MVSLTVKYPLFFTSRLTVIVNKWMRASSGNLILSWASRGSWFWFHTRLSTCKNDTSSNCHLPWPERVARRESIYKSHKVCRKFDYRVRKYAGAASFIVARPSLPCPLMAKVMHSNFNLPIKSINFFYGPLPLFWRNAAVYLMWCATE